MTKSAPKRKARTKIRKDPALKREASRLRLNAERLHRAVSNRKMPEVSHWPLPADAHPETFGLQIVGNCLAPRALEGQVVLVEPTMPKPGELAVFFFQGGGLPICKMLSRPIFGYPHHPESEVIPVAEIEQLNPPKHFHVLLNKVEAIGRVHSVVGTPAAVDNTGKVAASLI
jgi:hypothetical protein